MRALTADQQAVFNAGQQSEHVRVSIKDASGTFRDLTTYPGFNAVRSVGWGERIDDPHMTCDVVLLRELHRLSLSPLVAGSALNHGFDPTAAFAALIAMNREFKVEVAVVPLDRTPLAGDWMEVFRGRVDELDAAAGADVKFGGRSLGGRLAQQFIKTELVYSYAAHAGTSVPLRVWAPQMPVTTAADGTAGLTYCLPATRGAAAGANPADPGYNRFFKCAATGTTGTTEPTWTAGAGIADGSAVWAYVAAPTTTGNPVEQVMQNILNDHKAASDSAVTLYTPTSPSWAIRQYLQQREFTWDAVSKLAKQIGWDLRFKWRPSSAQFELTFSQPTRSSPPVAFTFAASDYGAPTRLAVNIANIRNSWRLVYSDRADLWPDGAPKRKVLEATDAASITKYGELWAEIQEDEASNIDSSVEATTLLAAALSDTKEPTAELGVPLTRGFPWVELNDYFTFAADGVRFDSAQSLAVTGWTQSYDAKGLKTKLELRGMPTIGAAAHLSRTVHSRIPVPQGPPREVIFDGTETAQTTTAAGVGGLVAGGSVGGQDKRRLADSETEHHIYRAPGTALSAATLRAVVKGFRSSTSYVDLVPGATYYGKTVQRSFSRGRLLRGQPSAEWTQKAGRASAGHLDSQVIPMGPPNGKFQHALDDLASVPPDHWTVVAGAWGATREIFHGTTTTNGRHVAFRQVAPTGTLRSSSWPIPRGAARAKLLATVRPQGALEVLRDFDLTLTFYGEETLTTSLGSVVSRVPWTIAAANVWADYSADVVIPAGANFVRLDAAKRTASAAYGFDLAGVYFQPSVPLSSDPWIPVTFLNSFLDYAAASYSPTAYMKDPMGFVHIRGFAKRATAALSTSMFTLPAGYTPAKEVTYGICADNRFARLVILPGGDIQIAAADSATWFSFFGLEGITFDAR